VYQQRYPVCSTIGKINNAICLTHLRCSLSVVDSFFPFSSSSSTSPSFEPIESARCTDDENLGSYWVVATPPTFWTGGVDGVDGRGTALPAANDDNAAAATTPIPDMDDNEEDMDDSVGEAIA